MAIVKISSSGRALLFIDDEGNSFVTSLSFFKNLVDGQVKGNFLLLTRLPDKVSKDRFKKSPLYGSSAEKEAVKESIVVSSDALSRNKLSEKIEQKTFEDKTVW